jgi:hypothetical protein
MADHLRHGELKIMTAKHPIEEQPPELEPRSRNTGDVGAFRWWTQLAIGTASVVAASALIAIAHHIHIYVSWR